VRIGVFTVEKGLFQVRKNSESSRTGDLLITKNSKPVPEAAESGKNQQKRNK
jgi:hypothetical protein